MGYGGYYYKQFGPYRTKVRAVLELSAQRSFQLVLAKIALCLPSCDINGWYVKFENLTTASLLFADDIVLLASSVHQTFSMHWASVQPNVKWLGLESVPKNMRSLFSTGKQWVAPS